MHWEGGRATTATIKYNQRGHHSHNTLGIQYSQTDIDGVSGSEWMTDTVPGSSAVSTQQQSGTVRHATVPPNGYTAVEEIAAQEFDEGADGALEQYYDLAAVVENTTPGVGLVVGDAAAQGCNREARKGPKSATIASSRRRTKQPPPENLQDWAGLPYGGPSIA